MHNQRHRQRLYSRGYATQKLKSYIINIMIFTNIRLQNFRSYNDDSFEIGSGVNVVVGPNGAGKTNLLDLIELKIRL